MKVSGGIEKDLLCFVEFIKKSKGRWLVNETVTNVAEFI